MLTSFHTHSYFCDGIKEPKEYVEQAIKKGFSALGFSSHVPIPVENSWSVKEEKAELYLQTIDKLKNDYKGKIEIYTGFEIDFLENDNSGIFKKYNVDYTIGSVHYVLSNCDGIYYAADGDDADFQRTLKECFKGDIKKFVAQYYRNIADMFKLEKPNIVGHLDVIRKNNSKDKYFSEKEEWYRRAVMDALCAIKESGSIVEVNTGGITRGYIQTPYPSQWILFECNKMEIPVIITSDAHAPENIDAYYDLALAILKETGYKEQVVLKGGKWTKVSL